jgi:hypothetical protein
MKALLFAAVACALITAAVVTAQNQPAPRPVPAAQPPAVPAVPALPKAAQPAQPRPLPVSAAVMLNYEENVELYEAQRDARKAYVRAAEVAVKSAELNYANLDKIAKAGQISREELEKGKLEVEAAKAHLEIRMAELKEIEVKLKYAKKRLDDAKAAGVRTPANNPFRTDPPKQVDPPPPGQ